jgi:hypothetical protein
MKRFGNLILFVFALPLIFTCYSCTRSADQAISISIKTQEPGISISPAALGLSYETRDILPDQNGEYYFHPDNRSLINMLKTLDIRHLRVGGNSVDSPNVPLPSEKDIHTFFQFARKAGLRVVYSIRLQEADPAYARTVAKIINDKYQDLVESISIGNEPTYYEDNDVYLEKWAAVHDAILEVYPDAVFNGPDTNPDVERMKALISRFDNADGRLVQITQHNYPFGCSYENPGEPVYIKLIPMDRVLSREYMLDPSAYEIYQEVLSQIQEAIEGTDLSFRLSETNSYWYSGLREVSNSFASALWGLDYLYWWTSHGAAGLDFHTGDVTGGLRRQPAFYAVFATSDEGYAAMPIAYGMKLFAMGINGKIIPVEVSTPGNQNIVAYSTVSNEGNVFLTIINKEYNIIMDQEVSIQFDRKIKDARIQYIALAAKDNDIAEINDITIGEASIEDDGSWEGGWNELDASAIDDFTFGITIPTASALLLKIEN